jgi:hypothetical protein
MLAPTLAWADRSTRFGFAGRRWRRGVTGDRELPDDRLDELFQAAVVRPVPIHLAAVFAAGELVVVLTGERLEPVEHVGFAHLCERAAAAKTASEWGQAAAEVETAQHVDDLVEWPIGAHKEAVCHLPSLEQTAIAGEHNAVLLVAEIGEGVVVEVAVIADVEADETQKPGEPAEVDVDDESRVAQRGRTKPADGNDVE